MSSSTDRIEREVLVKAPRSRVWRAIANAEEFGEWFGVNFTGKTFTAGEQIQGPITHPGYEHLLMDMQIESIEPERRLSWRWHPYAVETGVDYSQEPTTLVVFELSDTDGGTRVKLVESGFDAIPEGRRAEAFRMNSGGWTVQMENIAGYAASH